MKYILDQHFRENKTLSKEKYERIKYTESCRQNAAVFHRNMLEQQKKDPSIALGPNKKSNLKDSD